MRISIFFLTASPFLVILEISETIVFWLIVASPEQQEEDEPDKDNNNRLHCESGK